MSGLADLTAAGVAVWLDDLGRHRLETGQLADLVTHRHVVGVTSNPSIFAAAVGDGALYETDLRALAADGADAAAAVRALTTADVRAACDVLAPVFERTGGHDGRVSLEVDPGLAHDTEATVAQAAELRAAVGRPNLFVKIPATLAGLPAITEALAQGISVNVTLIFSVERYAAVLDAWLAGLERAGAAGHDLAGIHSVASFFVSRMDTAVDKQLDALGTEEATGLRGRAALANAQLAHARFEGLVGSSRWQTLAARGAPAQRPLWASTGTKDPSYSDTKYVTGLVTAGTVNTMPYATLLATDDHAEVTGDTVRGHAAEAAAVFEGLAALGIDYDAVVTQLEDDGVAAFEKSWQSLGDAVGRALAAASR